MNTTQSVELGINTTLNAIVTIAQAEVLKVARNPLITNGGPLIGFLQAIIENRDVFAEQMFTVAINSLPDEEANDD